MPQLGGAFAPADDVALGGNLSVAGSILSTGTAALGYSAGGGVVTQITSKSTAVILHKLTGAVTMHNANILTLAPVSFAVTNSFVAATDTVIVNHASGGTAGAYTCTVGAVGTGSFTLTVFNNTAGTLGEAIVLRFTVLKSVSA
jgi:hypothetical protein